MRARQIGLSRDTFYDSTLRELAREFAIAREVAREAHNRAMHEAWTIAALTRVHRFPSRPPFLVGDDTPARPSRDGILGALAVLSAQYGIPIVRRG